MTARPRIGGIGAVLVDHIQDVAGLPEGAGLPAPDTKMEASGARVEEIVESVRAGSGYRVEVGGPVPIALLYSRRLGSICTFAGRVAGDAAGAHIRRYLAENEIDDRAVPVVGGLSGQSHIWIDPEGRRSVLFSEDTMEPLLPSQVPDDFTAELDLLHIDGREPAAALELGAAMIGRGRQVVYDVGNWKSHSEALFVVATIAQLPARSAAACLGQPVRKLDLVTAARRIRDRYHLRMVVVTDGANGLGYSTQFGSGYMASHSVSAVDTNGAGDAFAGAMGYFVATGSPDVNALAMANAAAALKCTYPGHDFRLSLQDVQAARLGIPVRELGSVVFGPATP